MPIDRREPDNAPPEATELLLSDSLLDAAAAHVEQAIGSLPGAWADPLYIGNTSIVIRNCKFIFWLAAVQDAVEAAGRKVVIALQSASPGGVFSLPLIARLKTPDSNSVVTLTFLHMDLWPVALAARTVLSRIGRG